VIAVNCVKVEVGDTNVSVEVNVSVDAVVKGVNWVVVEVEEN
jgi:hypothetical protein